MHRGTWSSAIFGAVWLGLLMAIISTGVIVIWSGVPLDLWPAVMGGTVIGMFTAGLMLWLFHRHEITAATIWHSIGELWDEFGKSAF